MPTVASQDLNGPTVWRLAVLALVAGGFAVAYRSTGSVSESLVLGFLAAIVAVAALTAVSSLLRGGPPWLPVISSAARDRS